MEADQNQQTLPAIESIEYETTSVAQCLQRSDTREEVEMPAAIIELENSAVVKFVNGEYDLWAEYFHPKSPTETTAYYIAGQQEDLASEALNWISTYNQVSTSEELYGEFPDRCVNAILGQGFKTALDIFE